MAFGDLFLEDVREYREKFMDKTDLTPMFPIWDEPTDNLAKDMIDAGLRAKITCMDPKKIDREFAGREFNRDFLEALPDKIDPCGEYGEFHTFTWDGPMFNQAIQIQSGETVEREGFVFTDILPKLEGV
jgi:diphthamide synthase (EF-2-diphthine--ammonia ligase)